MSRELNRRIKDRFDAEGIEIPFPQQVMWVRNEAAPTEADRDGSAASGEVGDDSGAPRG